MKKIILLAAMSVVLNGFTFAQGYKVQGDNVIVEEIIENTGLPIKDCHDNLVAYFATAFNDSNHTTRLNEADHLIYKGTFSELCSFNITGMCTTSAEFILDIAIKDDRMRIQLCVSDVTVRRYGIVQPFSYRLIDAAPLSERHLQGYSIKVPPKYAIKTFETLISRMKNVVGSVRSSIANKSAADNW